MKIVLVSQFDLQKNQKDNFLVGKNSLVLFVKSGGALNPHWALSRSIQLLHYDQACGEDLISQKNLFYLNPLNLTIETFKFKLSRFIHETIFGLI